MTNKELFFKIEWEGGLMNAIEYGISSSDIDDPKIAKLWGEIVETYYNFNIQEAVILDALFED